MQGTCVCACVHAAAHVSRAAAAVHAAGGRAGRQLRHPVGWWRGGCVGRAGRGRTCDGAVHHCAVLQLYLDLLVGQLHEEAARRGTSGKSRVRLSAVTGVAAVAADWQPCAARSRGTCAARWPAHRGSHTAHELVDGVRGCWNAAPPPLTPPITPPLTERASPWLQARPVAPTDP